MISGTDAQSPGGDVRRPGPERITRVGAGTGKGVVVVVDDGLKEEQFPDLEDAAQLAAPGAEAAGADGPGELLVPCDCSVDRLAELLELIGRDQLLRRLQGGHALGSRATRCGGRIRRPRESLLWCPRVGALTPCGLVVGRRIQDQVLGGGDGALGGADDPLPRLHAAPLADLGLDGGQADDHALAQVAAARVLLVRNCLGDELLDAAVTHEEGLDGRQLRSHLLRRQGDGRGGCGLGRCGRHPGEN